MILKISAPLTLHPRLDWDYTLDVNQELKELNLLEEFYENENDRKNLILKIIAKLEKMIEEIHPKSSDIVRYVEELKDIAEEAENDDNYKFKFDAIWDDITDWAEKSRVWIKTS
jgi:hypothetical protein